jgi:uncharacterized protein YggE
MRIGALVLTTFIAGTALAQGVGVPPPPPAAATESSMSGLGRDLVIVSGTATVNMTPDMVSFTVGIETDGKQVREIVAENNAKTARVLSRLKSAGVSSGELRTESFHVSSLDRGEHTVGYRVTSEIGVTRKTAKDAGELIAAAIEAGANQVRGPEFSVANEKSVQDQCIELAFADARRKAQKLATLSERRLGKVLAITDGSSSPFELKYHSAGVEGGVLGGVTMEPGVHPVTCGVTAAFSLN